jgi:hypothetical protein
MSKVQPCGMVIFLKEGSRLCVHVMGDNVMFINSRYTRVEMIQRVLLLRWLILCSTSCKEFFLFR